MVEIIYEFYTNGIRYRQTAYLLIIKYVIDPLNVLLWAYTVRALEALIMLVSDSELLPYSFEFTFKFSGARLN